MTLPPCPVCGGVLDIEEKFVASPIGTWSLSGAQTKFVGDFVPHIVCNGCNLSVAGKPDTD